MLCFHLSDVLNKLIEGDLIHTDRVVPIKDGCKLEVVFYIAYHVDTLNANFSEHQNLTKATDTDNSHLFGETKFKMV